MKTQNVIVITGTELGWDCVVGVYETESDVIEDLELEPNKDFKDQLYNKCFVAHYTTVVLKGE